MSKLSEKVAELEAQVGELKKERTLYKRGELQMAEDLAKILQEVYYDEYSPQDLIGAIDRLGDWSASVRMKERLKDKPKKKKKKACTYCKLKLHKCIGCKIRPVEHGEEICPKCEEDYHDIWSW
jgi:DNA mismatch repair ATPase MutS